MNKIRKEQITTFNGQNYRFLMSKKTFDQTNQYLVKLKSNQIKIGQKLETQLKHYGYDLQTINIENFLECLINTKELCIFAESTNYTLRNQWNDQEVEILGDINCAIETEIYDNGVWSAKNATIHEQPINGALIFVPGAILKTATHAYPEYNNIIVKNEIDFKKYYEFYEHKLLSALEYANFLGARDNKKIFLTIPGIGCGAFAGKFSSTIHQLFGNVLINLIHAHHDKFQNISGIYFGSNENKNLQKIKHIDIITKNGKDTPQLCHPEEYGKAYIDCKLVKIVAWDHLSYPGNDYWDGTRNTDDGIGGAATKVFSDITGMTGLYHKQEKRYVLEHQKDYTFQQLNDESWKKYIEKNHINHKLTVKDRIFVNDQFSHYNNNSLISKFMPVTLIVDNHNYYKSQDPNYLRKEDSIDLINKIANKIALKTHWQLGCCGSRFKTDDKGTSIPNGVRKMLDIIINKDLDNSKKIEEIMKIAQTRKTGLGLFFSRSADTRLFYQEIEDLIISDKSKNILVL